MPGSDPQAGVGKGTVNPKARLALLTHSILFHCSTQHSEITLPGPILPYYPPRARYSHIHQNQSILAS